MYESESEEFEHGHEWRELREWLRYSRDGEEYLDAKVGGTRYPLRDRELLRSFGIAATGEHLWRLGREVYAALRNE